jgi:hypothetical protein
MLCKPGLELIKSSKSLPDESFQTDSSSLAGHTVIRLPTNEKYKKEWETLGIKWLESLDKQFYAKVLLPEGWTTETTDYSGKVKIRIIDGDGQEKVKMWLKTSNLYQETTVYFLKINNKLIELTDDQKQKVYEDEFKPICYPGYISKFYCSYQAIIKAIESWGKVEAILITDSGLNHTFIAAIPARKCSTRLKT